MKIVYFAPIPFNGLKQRPQHIAEELAKYHEVFYIDPTNSIMKFLLKGGETFFGFHKEVKENLHEIRLNGTLTAHRSLEALDFLNLNTISERVQLGKLLNSADAIWIGYSGWYNVIKNFKNKVLIYDKMDDDIQITKNPLIRKLILSVEPQLIKEANYIFVTAQQFYEDIKKKNPNTYLVPNAVSEDFVCNEEYQPAENKKVFGYIGMIDHWFDMDVIKTILEADKKNQVILAGPNNLPELKHERLTYLGVVPKEQLPKLINSFDVCLYPFKKTSLLDSINPVKIYEYLALNKPVLAVKSRETYQLENCLILYEDLSQLKNILQFEQINPFNNNENKIDFIKKNSWEHRTIQILKIIR
jgi:hypothetical protein